MTTALAQRPSPTSGWTDSLVRDICVERPSDHDDALRVRLYVETETKGFDDFAQVTHTYLDGAVLVESLWTPTEFRSVTSERIWTMANTTPVRTADVIDFGRLEQSVTRLVEIGKSFTGDDEPSAAQVEVMLESYAHILKWREAAARKLSEADGQIDIAAMVVRRFI